MYSNQIKKEQIAYSLKKKLKYIRAFEKDN